MVRAANTGVSMVIDRFGRIRNRLTCWKASGDTFYRVHLSDDITCPREDPKRTFYTSTGRSFRWPVLAIGAR